MSIAKLLYYIKVDSRGPLRIIFRYIIETYTHIIHACWRKDFNTRRIRKQVFSIWTVGISSPTSPDNRHDQPVENHQNRSRKIKNTLDK
jgi:hypothetical protein